MIRLIAESHQGAGDAEQLRVRQLIIHSFLVFHARRRSTKACCRPRLPPPPASPPEKGPASEAPPACLCVSGESLCKVPPGPLPCAQGTSVQEGLGLPYASLLDNTSAHFWLADAYTRSSTQLEFHEFASLLGSFNRGAHQGGLLLAIPGCGLRLLQQQPTNYKQLISK